MKLQNLIKRIEKAAGKKIEMNGNCFYMVNDNRSISFYENGQGSDSVVSVCCTMKDQADADPRNANCYDSFERKVKNVLSFIA